MKHKGLLSLGMSLVASLALFLFFTQGITFAAGYLHLIPHASCSGDACTSKDPYATQCADSRTYVVPGGKLYLFYLTNNNGFQNNVNIEVDLKYSPTCQSNWAEWHGAGGVIVGVDNFYLSIERQASAGLSQIQWSTFSDPNNNTYGVTRMVYAPNSPTQACGLYPGDAEGACTPFL